MGSPATVASENPDRKMADWVYTKLTIRNDHL